MKKIFFLIHLFFLIITSSVYGFSNTDKSNETNESKNYRTLVLPPNVDFSFNNNGTCSGTSITFTPIVTGDAPFTYQWDFGDGTTSNNSNPTHPFTALGCGFQNFNVKLTVTDTNGTSNFITKVISVQQKPDLKFVNLNAPAGSSATFEKCGDNNSDLKYTINVGNSSSSTSCITSYNVDWGDGSSETNVSFPRTHTYIQLGAFNMVITGIGSSSCNNSVTYVIKNSNNPIGALIAPGNTTNLCTPVAPMEFAIGSWSRNPSDTKYQVNYGDGTVVNYTQTQLESSPYYNAANPPASQNFPIPHKFTRFNCPSGNTVSLTITTSCGSTYLTAGPIIILDVPTISFNVNNIVCANTSVYFNNTTMAGYTNDCSTYNVYTWDFGDGSPVSRQVDPYHVYSTPGTYTIRLSAQTPCGIGTSTTRTICVEPILQPNFTFGNACSSTNLQMTNTTDTRLSCGTESYYWEVTYYIEGFCGKETITGSGRGLWNFANGTYSSSKDPVFNFVTPGTYYVRLTTRNSCGIDRSITKIIEVKKPPVTTLEPISDFCNSATINPVGTVKESCSPSSEITYLWSFPGGSPSSSTALNPGSINYSTSGNYQAVFSVTNSCGTTTKTANFSVDLVLSPIIKPKILKMCSGDTFQVTPVTNGTDNVPTGTTYIWSTPTISPSGAVSGATAQSSPRASISQTLTNNTSNPATVTYTVSPISVSCPGPNFTITITVDPLIKVAINQKNGTCFGSNDASIDITITGGIPFTTGRPNNISWTGPNGFTSTNEDISNLKPGTYFLNINDNGNCPFTKSYYVSEPDLFQFSGVKNDITCFGLNDGRINITTSGGTQPYTYVWTKDGNPYATTEDISNLEPGVYGVTITEVNKCNILTGTYTIIEPPLLEVNLVSQVNILCYGYYTGEININTIGGRATETSPGVFNYRYSWTGPNGFRSTLQNLRNVAAGTYNLTVTDNSGCTDLLQVTLYQNNEIKLEYTKTEIACYNYADASITINKITGGIPFATGNPYIIKWSNLGTGLVQNNLTAGTYIISITDSLDCEKQFTIIIDNAPVFTINPDIKQISCFGEKDAHIRLNLIGGKAPVILVWDDNATAGIERNNLGPGKYTVTITDAKSCKIKETFNIIEPLVLELKADVSNPLSCLNANTGAINLVVTGGTQPFKYAWSNGATTEDLNNLTPNNYTVTVTDANGCKKSETWKITRFKQLTPTVEVITDFNCDTKYVHQTFVGHIEGGIPPYQLKWSDGMISGANNEIMNTENNGLIIFSVTDSFGCVADYSFNVNTPVLGKANFSTSSYGKDVYDLYAIYDPVLFTNLATGDFTKIAWDFGDGNFSDEESPKHIYTREGTYTIKQTVTYPFGCQYIYTATLIIEKGYSLMMPNAFTPNNDSYNDSFAPVFIGLTNINLDVYDTWGNIIYSESGKNIKGWNGKVKDLDAENGNYYFKITAKTFYNHTITEKGAFTLIK
ncbi:PKD domain-containing protein [Flavobacterium sp.]|uniref:PKD domain-containing protein n=1 Tax=Flavobacterium sp. TaxID=239 RepID=UPI001B496324|nr:PKD domain-containing protein [Flavobacterium sp.]MBP6181612.1 PKD domain-containing protein [Flavobacterium sp.]